MRLTEKLNVIDSRVPRQPRQNLLRFHGLLNLVCHQIKSSSATLDHSPTATTDYKKFPRITTSSSQQSLALSSPSSPSSSLHVALRSFRVRDKTPKKNYPLLYKPVSQRSFQKVGWKPNQKASDFVSQNLPFFRNPVLPSLSLCLPASEREICDPVLAAEFHTRTCNRRRPGRVLCRELDLFGVALFTASPLSCGGRSRPALPQRSVPVPTAKEPDPKTGDHFSPKWNRTRIVFFLKMRIFFKNKKGRIFCHNILVFLNICQISKIIQIILNSDFSLVKKKKLTIFLIV
jgi:hypothetical protein